ncbi:MAG: ATP-binding protein [Myxococcales bacterium]|nr:ATP-binding protein [Myxococcales bacterium]
MEVVFTAEDMQFRYGMAATSERVQREWLHACTPGQDDEQPWFEREGEDYQVGPGWKRDPSIEQKTRPEALHLSVAAAFNHQQAIGVLRWFQRLRLINSASLLEQAAGPHTARLLSTDTYGDTIRALLCRLDFGIDDLKLAAPDPRLRAALDALFDERNAAPTTRRNILDSLPPRVVAMRSGVEFDLERDESAGTVKAFELAGPLVQTLAQGDVIVIDEFDARLHTLLAKQLVELFQDPRTNPHDAQLVFASHDTNLLTRTLLRRDQLWFVEKSRKTHASDLYSLAELRLEDGKGVRNDARYEADYLQGKYGAIPFFGSLEAILADTAKSGD